MNVFITDIQPNPVFVVSGQTVPLSVTAMSATSDTKAYLVITNKRPRAVELFDSNERGDQIRSNRITLKSGANHLTHVVGFQLDDAASTRGATIGVELHVEDSNQGRLSEKRTILVVIGAI